MGGEKGRRNQDEFVRLTAMNICLNILKLTDTATNTNTITNTESNTNTEEESTIEPKEGHPPEMAGVFEEDRLAILKFTTSDGNIRRLVEPIAEKIVGLVIRLQSQLIRNYEETERLAEKEKEKEKVPVPVPMELVAAKAKGKGKRKSLFSKSPEKEKLQLKLKLKLKLNLPPAPPPNHQQKIDTNRNQKLRQKSHAILSALQVRRDETRRVKKRIQKHTTLTFITNPRTVGIPPSGRYFEPQRRFSSDEEHGR